MSTVLIVEDSVDLAETLNDVLTLHGFTAITAITGGDGLHAALTNHPDLILLDLRLPDMSGYTVYQKLREDAWGKTARVLILTASEALENIAKNIDLPLEYIMFKPDLSIKEIVERIELRLQTP